jgi:hypothetical protein
MVMSMALTLAAARDSGFSIPDRFVRAWPRTTASPRRALPDAGHGDVGAKPATGERAAGHLPRSAVPEALDELGVGLDVRAEDQHFEAAVVGLERARDARAHPHGIERLELDQLVVELHAP